ncbi:Flagellar hook-length control protein FliK [Pseudonocardia sp. Ae717_Ps2]|uniref:type IV secretion system protein n=1 Tax=Pseudonocardia sp. Ae717_Ps2 TaxID=1885573 RepID=UPI000966C0F0|nr:type IV secretion system protein [Pseudonocardia sp. Ae717_Ps2]OLM28977.1 Flagellar hook-length control protein FliK [Pseudonocardia sp. Ae717_Ps2]
MTAHIRPTQPPEPPPDNGNILNWRDLGSGLIEDGLNWAGEQASQVARDAFSSAMQWVWDAAIWLLKGGFSLADTVSRVEPGTLTGNTADNPDPLPAPDGPAATPAPPPETAAGAVDLGLLWSTMIWLATLIALGLFFFQLASVALRGGRGMVRAVTGPAQFGIALAVTTGAVAILLTGADGLTIFFLSFLGEQGSFTAILAHPAVVNRFGANPDLGAEVTDGVRAMILGIAALFGVVPAAVGFALAMIFRAAAIMVLIATIPIAAACLIADTTAPMFWKVTRWLLAAVLMKPALALVLVIGVAVISRAEGVAGLLGGTAVLLISLFCPTVLYRVLPFVEPGTNAGMALRSLGSRSGGGGEPGADNGTTEAINTARMTGKTSDLAGSSASNGAVGGELGGSTAAPRTAPAAGGGSVTAAGGATGGAAGGGVGAAVGAVGGAAAAAVVGGYLATKAAGHAAAGYASSQMAQTGIGHPGPAPTAAASGGQISSAAGSAYTATAGHITQPAGAPDHPDDPDDPGSSDGDGGGGPGPPPVDPGPPGGGPTGPASPSPGADPDPPGSTDTGRGGTDREDGR